MVQISCSSEERYNNAKTYVIMQNMLSDVQCTLRFRKSKMIEGTIMKLSEDVAINIFFKLPMKSISGFKCVTRSWCTLIQSVNFINLHLKSTSTTKNEFILFKQSFKEENVFKNILSFLLSVDDEDDVDPIYPDLDVPYLCTTYGSIFHQLNSPCRGLIFMTDSKTSFILNPSIRKHRLIPTNYFVGPHGFYRAIAGVGLGYDSIQRSYKVIKFSKITGEPPFNDPSMLEQIREVYDSSSDSWRELAFGEEEFPWPNTFPFSERYYKGGFHWYAHRDLAVLFCFDMSTKIFA